MTEAISLIPCSACEHQIGTQAEVCPQCGSRGGSGYRKVNGKCANWKD